MDTMTALIGFGEAGSTFAAAACDAARWRTQVRAYDIDPSRHQAMRDTGIAAATDPRSALAGARIVLSLVTADQALSVAQEYAEFLSPAAIWIDLNSVAPETKRKAANTIEKSGGRYVDAAILAPVHTAQMNVPILLAGSSAEDAQVALQSLGFDAVRIVGAEIGRASSIKLIRSVMVKGTEALTHEMMAAAEAAGVSEEVLASLDASEKSGSWFAKAAYNLERMATHGERRAAEMEEAAHALRSLGVEPVMTEGTVHLQRDAAIPPAGKRNAS